MLQNFNSIDNKEYLYIVDSGTLSLERTTVRSAYSNLGIGHLISKRVQLQTALHPDHGHDHETYNI
jgi:hypothetical protein